MSEIDDLDKFPDEAMDEALDFIDFVAARRAEIAAERGIQRLQEGSINDVWNTPEDEVWNDVQSRCGRTSHTVCSPIISERRCADSLAAQPAEAPMKVRYSSDTDTLYIDLADRPSVDSDET